VCRSSYCLCNAEHDGHWLSTAGRQTGLYTDALQLQIDAVEGTVVDIGSALNPFYYKNALPRNQGQYARATLSFSSTVPSLHSYTVAWRF
jgi:hypothetical protein